MAALVCLTDQFLVLCSLKGGSEGWLNIEDISAAVRAQALFFSEVRLAPSACVSVYNLMGFLFY